MIHHGDCLDVMAAMEPGSVDAVVTDPPYGLEFMGKEWDKLETPRLNESAEALPMPETSNQHAHSTLWRTPTASDNRGGRGTQIRRGSMPESYRAGTPAQAWHQQWAEAAYRVAKPSAYLLAFGGTRTVHRMTVALEDAGWIIRDMLVWAYASGFPKSKASLKPAWEPIVMARKPGPLRDLAIDLCRIGPPLTPEEVARSGGEMGVSDGRGIYGTGARRPANGEASGRWPANVILTDPIFDGGVEGVVGGGEAGGGFGVRGDGPLDGRTSYAMPGQGQTVGYGDSGTYSRFYSIPRYNETCNRCGAPIAGGTSSDGGTTDTPSGTAPEIASSLPNSSSSDPAPSAATRSGVAGGNTARQHVPLWDDEESGSRPEAPTTNASETTSSSDADASTPPDRTSKPRGTSPVSEPPSSPAKSPDAASLATGTTTTTRSPYLCVTCAVAITSATTGPSAPIDRGDPTRFLIIPKADRADREPVLGGLPLRDDLRGSGVMQYHCAKCGKQMVNVPGAACKCDEPEIIRGASQKPRANVHPTVKPTELMRHLVRLVTPAGGLVLDPFLGSGTTGLACELEGFPWVGIEREEEYVKIAQARLNGTQRGLGLVG